jgi:threonine dehydratase
VQVHDRKESARLVRMLAQHGFKAVDMSGNEMAKLHVRHMVGGHAPQAKNEIVYRFEFPERPGALVKFLDAMSKGWNISLFHYRNHGADYGRVLVGMQVPPEDKRAFRAFLDEVGYRFWEETDNPAYRLYLG